ncbi:MAG: sugar transferase [Bacteroidetes bacterium]|nr:sugar transferase [Bacteroidota bacterium]HOA38295.1 sugar transferase [Flavihumibacter sp.]
MESMATLTATATHTTGNFRRYAVTREMETAPVAKIITREFFYVGTNSRSINNLVNLFDGGYATESIQKALNIIRRIEQQQKTAPAVFIIENTVSLNAVAELVGYLRSKEEFHLVPVLMDRMTGDTTNQDPATLQRYYDDVIDTRKVDSKLIQRINFLGKVKMKSRLKAKEKLDLLEQLRQKSTLAFGRRLFDIVVSMFAIIFTLPLMALIAIAIKLESKGPVFYISKRAGRGYRVFDFIKFRTMRCDADKQVDQLKHLNSFGQQKVFFKVVNDPRTTRIGKWLRNTSLDELPQFFNVLKGDMSIVGNRPLPLYEASMLTTDDWSLRFMAPSGITGLWQIRKKDRHAMTTEERIKLDLVYSRKQSFLYDLWILLNTPPALIQRGSA